MTAMSQFCDETKIAHRAIVRFRRRHRTHGTPPVAAPGAGHQPSGSDSAISSPAASASAPVAAAVRFAARHASENASSLGQPATAVATTRRGARVSLGGTGAQAGGLL